MKYLLLVPIFLFYMLRDMATLLQHQDLLRGIGILILLSAVGIFFTAWLEIAKSQSRVRRKLGDQVYEWLINEPVNPEDSDE